MSKRGFIALAGLTKGLMTPKAMKKTGIRSLEQVVLGNRRSSTQRTRTQVLILTMCWTWILYLHFLLY